jgi:hypothetical protein
MPSRCLCHAVSRYLPSTWIFRQRKRATVKDGMLLSNRNRKKQRVYCRSRSTSRSTSRSSLYQCRFCLRPRGKNILRKPLRRKLWLSGSTSNSQEEKKLTGANKAVLLALLCGNKRSRPKLGARSRRSTCNDAEETTANVRDFEQCADGKQRARVSQGHQSVSLPLSTHAAWSLRLPRALAEANAAVPILKATCTAKAHASHMYPPPHTSHVSSSSHATAKAHASPSQGGHFSQGDAIISLSAPPIFGAAIFISAC